MRFARLYDMIKNMENIKKNEQYTVLIEGYSSDAYGVCRINGQAVFVPGTLVGESWEIKIVKVTSTAIYAKALRRLDTSPQRILPNCPSYGICGGCGTCHMSYAEELRFKLEKVNSALQRIGKQTVLAEEILGSETTKHYRNKAIFAVAQVNGQPRYGFYRPRSHDLIPIETCFLQSELSSRAAATVVDFMFQHNIEAYDEQTGRGHVRHVFCRNAVHGEDAVVCIVTARGFGALTKELVSSLRLACPELSGVVLNINKSRGNTVLCGDFHTLWGNPNIHDSLCGVAFEISPQAFFQVNPPQAERLYNLAVTYAVKNDPSLVLDLYCGAGTISLCLAKHTKKVIGAEIVPEAVENARANARRNHIENAEFICADAGQAAQELARRALHPDTIVVDPPRKGLSESVIDAISDMQPGCLVYVSCNPATLARDLLRFQDKNYIMQEAVAVDMFPRTSHVETVVLLCRKAEKAERSIEVSYEPHGRHMEIKE